MEMTPQILTAQVMHKRLFPKENQFIYNAYYLVLPLPAPTIQTQFLRFDPKDLGNKDGSDPEIFAKKVLTVYGFEKKTKDMVLITMPRVFGYLFNPVSFYLCFDEDKKILAVIAEVHNTFGEQHAYFCAKPDHSSIDCHEWLEAQKIFHVSPFLPCNGYYRFRFSAQEKEIGIWINYFDLDNNKQLMTSLTGRLEPLNTSSLRRVFWGYPFLTLKIITLIHWQALKLFYKKVKYFKKPKQLNTKLSATLK